MLDVVAFGNLAMQKGGVLVDHFPTRQVKELLAFLLLKPYQPHSREALMTLLWPESDVDGSRHRFNIVVWRLRNLFRLLGLVGEDVVHSNRERVMFAPKRPFRFDQDEFVRQTKAGLVAKELVLREEMLTHALSLWQGEPFAGLYTSYCLIQREDLELLRIDAWRQLMADCYTRRAYSEAIGWGEAILREDPLREQVHRELMRCYVAQGRPTRAVRQYLTCAQVLEQELGIRPFSATQRLYAEILQS